MLNMTMDKVKHTLVLDGGDSSLFNVQKEEAR
jgi:hypothetical protein